MHQEAHWALQTDIDRRSNSVSAPTAGSAASIPTGSALGGQASIVPEDTYRTKIRRRVRHKRQHRSKKLADFAWKAVMILLALVVAAGIVVVIRALVNTEVHSLSQSDS